MSIEALGLVKQYKQRRVVDDVSFSVNPGEVVGLLGPNGAGKTTSFYMIVGLEHCDQGEVRINRKSVTQMPMHLRAQFGVSYLPQESSIFRKLSVKENLLAILELRERSPRVRHQRAKQLMEEFSVSHLSNNKGFTLSGGERRRVEIARALALEPHFILLDEPFTGVDPIAVAEIQDIIRRLKEKGLGVLITDHSVRETLAITDRAYIMHSGKILVSGDAEFIANDESARRFYLGERFSM